MTTHPTALVSERAQIGKNAVIGAFTSIHSNVVVGDDCTVDAYCSIGEPTPHAHGRSLLIGNGARIRSHSVFYEGSTFGAGLETGHRVTVREGVVAGVNLRIGTGADIQGDSGIGDYVRFHSGVFISKNSVIGDFVWLFPRVVLTEDPHPPSAISRGVTIERYAAIAAAAVLLPGVRIGEDSLVGAHALVGGDVGPDTVVVGVPARRLCKASDIRLEDGSMRPAYPWRTHFHRGYPEEVVGRWLERVAELQRNLEPPL